MCLLGGSCTIGARSEERDGIVSPRGRETIAAACRSFNPKSWAKSRIKARKKRRGSPSRERLAFPWPAGIASSNTVPFPRFASTRYGGRPYPWMQRKLDVEDRHQPVR